MGGSLAFFQTVLIGGIGRSRGQEISFQNAIMQYLKVFLSETTMPRAFVFRT